MCNSLQLQTHDQVTDVKTTESWGDAHKEMAQKELREGSEWIENTWGWKKNVDNNGGGVPYPTNS